MADGEQPPFLYHATSAAIAGEVLKPYPNTTLAGVDGDFVFAMDDERMAYAYSMKQNAMTPGIPRMRACLALMRVPCVFIEFEHLLPQLPTGTIYLLPRAGFTQVIMTDGTPTSEYVSTSEVYLAGLQRITGITPEMVMEKGVQIFFLDPLHIPHGDIGAFMTAWRKDAPDKDAGVIAGVRQMLAVKGISHLNAVRGIKAHPAFQM